MRTTAAGWPIIAVYAEREDPDDRLVGAPTNLTSDGFTLQEITPEAAWHETVSRWTYREVTRVEFGGAYEDSLLAVAGPRQRD
jgi:hypothetical protein